MLKSRITRIIAGTLACAIAGGCGLQIARLMVKANEMHEAASFEREFEVRENMDALHRQLITVGYMYLKQLDENGEFTGTEYAEKQTEDILKDIGLMNSMGELDIDSKDFEYRVSYGKNDFSNTEKSHEELAGEYSLMHRNGNIEMNYHLGLHYGDMINWFTTDYGMTYYYIDSEGYAIFDFDTEDCDSYVDELGATIYYKLDGTTPIPYDYVDLSAYGVVTRIDTYIVDDEESETPFVVEDVVEVQAVTEDAETEHSTIPAETVENSATAEDIPDNAVTVTDIAGEEASEVVEESIEIPENEAVDNSDVEAVTDVIENVIEEETEPVTERATLPDVDNESFVKTQMPEDEIQISIRPNDEIIAAIEKMIANENAVDEMAAKGIIELIPFGVAALILSLYVLIAGGYSKKEKKYAPTVLDNVWAELYLAIGGAALIGIIACYAELDDFCEILSGYYNSGTFMIISGVVTAIAFGIVLLTLNSIIIRIKCGTLIKTSLTGKLLKFLWGIVKKLWGGIGKIASAISEKAKNARAEYLKNTVTRDMLRNDKFTRSFILRTGIAVVLLIISALISVSITDDSGSAFVLMLICGIIILSAYVYFSLADLKAIQRMNEHISAIHSGDYTARKEDMDSPIYTITEKLNGISTGIQENVEKQVKSERMKIELVTNVSHDLKTPLTSIISYIDLLSAEELPPVARDYVTIIEEKSQRLKTMVADLFDLAKATSRTDVQAEEIDAVVLTRQVIGDLADKIEASGRQLKCDIQAETAPICADGKKLYRVFQNVIDNALKYSMEGTRVYLTLKRESGRCEIAVKNIASYEMTFSPDEITERFTRGDESRSTEGNGLGLSIAKSFTEACGGEFNVEIDGDVFIAKILFNSH